MLEHAAVVVRRRPHDSSSQLLVVPGSDELLHGGPPRGRRHSVVAVSRQRPQLAESVFLGLRTHVHSDAPTTIVVAEVHAADPETVGGPLVDTALVVQSTSCHVAAQRSRRLAEVMAEVGSIPRSGQRHDAKSVALIRASSVGRAGLEPATPCVSSPLSPSIMVQVRVGVRTCGSSSSSRCTKVSGRCCTGCCTTGTARSCMLPRTVGHRRTRSMSSTRPGPEGGYGRTRGHGLWKLGARALAPCPLRASTALMPETPPNS